MAVRVRVPLAAPYVNTILMRKINILAFSASTLIILSSCSSKLGALSPDNFVVAPDPLEARGGQVSATINGTFPEKYMKKKAVVTVIPELRYGDGQVAQGLASTFQGEKVKDNNQTISYRLGGKYNMKTSFDYVPEMLQSDMYLTFDAKVGKKSVKVPAVKVATGVLATSELYKQALLGDGACIAPDTFQRVQTQKQEASVKFLVNQAILRQSELKNNSVQEFVKLLKNIQADQEKLNIKNVEVSAYASPEGGFSYNEKLANKRKDVSEDYVKQQLKGNKMNADIDARYTAEDWEGFQQLVQASNIQDKDVILRVLSMYKDPEEREKQIRNLSEGFRELADQVLPELRRARMVINYDIVGRTDEQIIQQYAADPKQLSNEELLYAAALVDDASKKEEIYKATTLYCPNDYRAFNNLAALELNKGNVEKAKSYIEQAKRVNAKAPEAFANEAFINLTNGNTQDAENALSRAIGANGYDYMAGVLSIAKGDYIQAERFLAGTKTNNAGLAHLLNNNLQDAISALDAVKSPTAITSYIHAIVAAHNGNKFATSSYLQEALEKDPTLKAYSDKDLELSILKGNQ